MHCLFRTHPSSDISTCYENNSKIYFVISNQSDLKGALNRDLMCRWLRTGELLCTVAPTKESINTWTVFCPSWIKSVDIYACVHQKLKTLRRKSNSRSPARPPAPVTAPVYVGWLLVTGCWGTSFHFCFSPTRPPSGFSYRWKMNANQSGENLSPRKVMLKSHHSCCKSNTLDTTKRSNKHRN